MKITHLDDYLTTEDEPIGFELNPFSPDGDGRFHTHAFFEVVYMVDGHARHEIVGKSGERTISKLDKGSVILLTLDEAHHFLSDKNSKYLHRDVVIRKSIFKECCDFLSPTLYDEIINKSCPMQITVSDEKIVQFEQKIKLINKILPSKKEQKKTIIKAFVVSLLECFCVSDTEEYFNNFPTWFNEFLSNFHRIECIKAGLPEIVSYCNYDKKYLCCVFKKYTGVTMTEYLNDARLNYAVGLLQNTSKTVSDIALELGFSSVSYFNVIFKKRFGATPKEMRKKPRYKSYITKKSTF